MNSMKNYSQILLAVLVVLLFFGSTAQEAQDQSIVSGFLGAWIVNEELSDNTDDQVEEAIEAGGGKGSRGFFNRKEDFYRGGPVEQELYDRISYDDLLSISYQAPEFRFEYEGGWLRVFHTDGRRRSTTANDFYSEGGDDFSFANFDSEAIIVEARPRDGGFTLETYTLINNGSQLRVEMVLEPDSFREAIELVLIYDRVDGSSNDSNN